MAGIFIGAKAMIPQNRIARFLLQKIGSMFIAFMFTGTVFVFYQSFWPHDPPFHIEGQNATITRDSTGVILTWDCKSYATRKVSGHVHRWLVNSSSGETVSMPSTEISMVPGKYEPPVKSFILPATLKTGEWCLKSRIEYFETGSLKESEMPGLNVCFEVPPLNLADHSELARRVQELEKLIEMHSKADFEQHAEILKKEK